MSCLPSFNSSPALSYPVKCIIIDLGNRGTAYSKYSLDFPEKMRIISIVEPRESIRRRFGLEYNISLEDQYSDYIDLLLKPKMADLIIIATPDSTHKEITIECAKKGYNILLEKPMATTIQDCIDVYNIIIKTKILFGLCHVLRYAPWNKLIKLTIDSGNIGQLLHITHTEPIGYYHFAHSYVRGNWRREDISSFLLLTKSCHDIDLINYWINSKCIKTSSFGTLKHFKKENKPKEAKGCMECPIKDACIYSAPKIYLTQIENGNKDGLVKTLCVILDIENVTKALECGPYGKCVYECDNDVVDHQCVNLEFESGVTSSFNMIATTEKLCQRETKAYGSLGEITCDTNNVYLYEFSTGIRTKLEFEHPPITRVQGHQGADYFLIDNFINAVAANNKELIASNALQTLQSHLICFAAEKSRIEENVVKFKDFLNFYRID